MTRNTFFEEITLLQSQGRISYPEALRFMEQRAKAIREDGAPEVMWMLEHPPLFTEGTSAKAEDLFNPRNFPTYKAGRGGQWTYHGPGQRIIYLMLDLMKQHGVIPARDLRAFVCGLEKWVIRALGTFGVEGEIRDGRVGVWVVDPLARQEAKIAALGIRVSRWVSWHGVSINLDPDLSDFEGIVPCGISTFGVTSLSRFHPGLSMAELDTALVQAWIDIFGQVPSLRDGDFNVLPEHQTIEA